MEETMKRLPHPKPVGSWKRGHLTSQEIESLRQDRKDTSKYCKEAFKNLIPLR